MSSEPKRRWKCELVKDPSSKPTNAIRVIGFSDTHTKHNDIKKEWFQPADIAIFAGDFSNFGSLDNTNSFKSFFKSLPYKHKILIAGNHDLTFDVENRKDVIDRYLRYDQKDYKQVVEKYEEQTGQKIVIEKHKYNDDALNFIKKQITEDKELIYLEESSVTIDGLKIYGTPYSPFFCNWGFPTFPQKEKEKGGLEASRWNKIPNDTDIVIVHGPPYKILDDDINDGPCGCPFLAEKMSQIRPSLCIFGHIHEAYGVKEIGDTIYANVSTLDVEYKIRNMPMLFDLIPIE